MAFVKDQKTLEKLVTRAIESKEIRDAIDSVGPGPNYFRELLRQRAEKIWSAAAEELIAYSSLEESLTAARFDFYNATPGRGIVLRLLDPTTKWTAAGLLLATIGIFVFGVTNAARLKSAISILSSTIAIYCYSAFALLIVWRVILGRLYNNRYAKYKAQFEAELPLQQLQKDLEESGEVIEEILIERGIKPELRAIINEELTPSYDLNLSIKTSPGLGEVFDPAYEIPTGAKGRLLSMLEDMPGGSVGIAGPRGAGKSTLIWSLCRGAITSLKGRRLFAVMTSAPVKYDGRDFVLHLFSSICYKVLGREPAQETLDENPSFGGRIGRTRDWRKPLLQYQWLTMLLLTVGGLLFVLWLPLARQAVATAEAQERSKSAHDQASPTPPASPSPAGTSGSDLKRILSVSGVTPGLILSLAAFCLFGGSFSSVFFLYTIKRKREQDVREESQQSVISPTKEVEGISRDVANMATRMLHQIRFQQSFSSGWSGSLKLPIGVEGGLNSALSLAEKQRSFPEIVDAYRSFIKKVTAKNAVLIGIDELDKLESDEMAQQFINEIKSIFGLDHCYYLISVSENAISAFERRGLPFRDAFDSAFDTILYVDYLDLDKSKRLLRRRVIGLQVPFICLCHCLSGGLARDLIRSCREMLELVKQTPTESDLTAVCTKLVIADVKAKLNAIEVSARNCHLEPELSNIIDVIRKVLASTENRDIFLETRRRLEPPKFQILRDKDAEPAVIEGRQRINDLALELHTYLYFADTLLEFFSSSLTKDRLIAAEAGGHIAQLASARQSFAVNAYTALVLLDEFRASNGLVVA
jgi:hypothetical protein